METTMTLAGVILLCVSSISVTMTMPTFDLCAGCTMVNGAAFNKHPTDCDKFVQCHFDASGKLVGDVRHCAFGTYWQMELLTCVPASQATCTTDMCVGQEDGYRRHGGGNCRGYWECRNHLSVAACCPAGQYYNRALGCVDNDDKHECTDTCLNDRYEYEGHANTNDAIITTTPMTCSKRAVPTYYQEEISGRGWVTRQCPAGTKFVQDNCGCVHTGVPVKTCRPEIYLPFTHDHTDQSGRGNYIGNENVIVENGVAKFNGVNSRLIIPRFTNFGSSKIIIKVKYSSRHGDLTDEQTIISNNDCGIESSIRITEDSDTVNFGVVTSRVPGHETSVSAPQTSVHTHHKLTEKNVVYKFLNGVLSGEVDNQGKVTSRAPGVDIHEVHCALHIGHAEDVKPFHGEIDELSIYLCDPDE